jgi:hypothetical protein
MWTETGSFLSGTWNTVLYPDFDHFPVYSCFLEHGTQSFIHILINCQSTLASGNMEHCPVSRLCSFSSHFSSGNMERSPLSRLYSIAILLVLPGNMEYSPLSRLCFCQSTLASWNMDTILYPDFDQLPVFSCFWAHGTLSCIQIMLNF